MIDPTWITVVGHLLKGLKVWKTHSGDHQNPRTLFHGNPDPVERKRRIQKRQRIEEMGLRQRFEVSFSGF